MTKTGFGLLPHRTRTCSDISFGPVAQFIPITSMSYGSREPRAAEISVPSSSVPIDSTVTEVMTGTRRRASRKNAKIP